MNGLKFVLFCNRAAFLKNEHLVAAYANIRKLSSDASQTILSGIQPTGIAHIGNYFGAIMPLVNLQNQGDKVIVSIVDLHSITVPKQNNELRSNIMTMAACLIACGIDPLHTIFFQQSEISQHAELAWVLTCITSMARLLHLPQWKEKSANVKDVPLGLLAYPVLQAADILLYKATSVPVGDDQIKHIELARDLAKTFNKMYKTHFFPIPQAKMGASNRIHSLRNPSKKMSKSDEDMRSRIELTDSDDMIREKIKKSITDNNSTITYDPIQRPGISNLIDIHCAVQKTSVEQICDQCRGLDTLQYKMLLADVLIEHLRPIRQKTTQLINDPTHLLSILKQGRDKASALATNTFDDVRRLVGFR